ncbi:hypothetical protein JCM10449v2_004804 [Rhodotorula kratochvilovae]
MSGILNGRTRVRAFSITLVVLAAEQAMSYILPSDGAFVASPTDANIIRLREIRATALEHPLKPGLRLAWNGPNRHPETLPPIDYPHHSTPEPFPHSPRPLLSSLLTRRSPSQVGRGWSPRLVEELKGGVGKYAQVWRCEVDEPGGANGGKSASVVVKLYRQSLFPFPATFPSRPETDSWNWYPATHLEMRESRAYSRLLPYQGHDVPICYGFYTFDLPGGERCVGAVLEDLTELSVPLESHLKAMLASKRLQLDTLDPLVVAALEVQNRVHTQDLAQVANHLAAFLVLNFSEPRGPLLVTVGFSRTTTGEACIAGLRIVHGELLERLGPGYSTGCEKWQYGDQARLLALLDGATMEGAATMQDWKALERGRRKLSYLSREW